MIKEASKIVDLAVEFCRNNLDILMICGAVLVVFIVLISIFMVSKGGDDEELDFDEIAYNKKKKEEKAVVEEPAELETEAVKEVEFVAVALPPLTARVMAWDEEQAEEVKVAVTETVEPLEPEVTKEPVIEKPAVIEPQVEVASKPTVSRNTSCLEDIIEGLANLSADGVKKVEIKIQGAEVKITYGDDKTLSIAEEPCKEETPLETECQLQDKKEQAEIVEENKEKITEVKTYKKFGPDNNNVTRSGRVFSEEELEKQIRD